jgi:hypothetical protein
MQRSSLAVVVGVLVFGIVAGCGGSNGGAGPSGSGGSAVDSGAGGSSAGTGGSGTGGSAGSGTGGSAGAGTGGSASTGVGGFSFDGGFPFDAAGIDFDALFNLDAGTCADLSACCSRLTGQLQTQCNMVVSNGSDPTSTVA